MAEWQKHVGIASVEKMHIWVVGRCELTKKQRKCPWGLEPPLNGGDVQNGYEVLVRWLLVVGARRKIDRHRGSEDVARVRVFLLLLW